MKMLKVLAMDTVFAQGSLALLEGGQVRAHATFAGQEGHVVLLPGEIERSLAHVGWCGRDLDLIAVTVGPGSFTGSRIAMGVAKGFAAALGVPVIGVSTLELLVASVEVGEGVSGRKVAAILDARRGEVYAALYEVRPGFKPVPRMPPGAKDPLLCAKEFALVSLMENEKIILTGSGLALYAELFQQALGLRCEMTDPAVWHLDTVRLGLLAQERMNQPGELSVECLEPLYLRRADAKERVFANVLAPAG